MCGGVGTKMWPLSRRHCPKHFLPLLGDQSLFQANYKALRLQFSPQDIYIQTNAQQAKIAKRQVPEIPNKNFFIEPEMRNHGPAMGLMAARLSALDPDEPFIIVQADVLRRPTGKFIGMIACFDKLIRSQGKLITGGIKQKKPVMGVDYLVAKKKVAREKGIDIYQMDKWLWRDTRERVKKYFKNNYVFTHANHYAWTPRLLLAAYKKGAPDWYQSLAKITKALGTSSEEKVVLTEYAKMEKGPAERVTKEELLAGYVAELPFEWFDLGTWESLYGYLMASKRKVDKDRVLEIEASGCYVVRKDPKKLVSLIGVKDLVVVDTGDALLVCNQKESGQVGKVVEWLKKEGEEELY